MLDSFHTRKMNMHGFLLVFSASLQLVYGTQPSTETVAEERSYRKEPVYTLYNTGYGNSNQGHTIHDTGYSNHNSGYSNHNSGYSNSNSGYSNSKPGYIKSFTKFMSKLAAKGKKWRKKYQNYRDNYRSNEITYVIPLPPHPHPHPHPPLRPPLPFPLWFREQQKKSKFPSNPDKEKDTFKVHHESSHVDIKKGEVHNQIRTKVICEKCMNYGPNHEAFPKNIPGKILSQSPKHIEFLSKGGKTEDGFEALRSNTIIGTSHSPKIIDGNYHESNRDFSKHISSFMSAPPQKFQSSYVTWGNEINVESKTVSNQHNHFNSDNTNSPHITTIINSVEYDDSHEAHQRFKDDNTISAHSTNFNNIRHHEPSKKNSFTVSTIVNSVEKEVFNMKNNILPTHDKPNQFKVQELKKSAETYTPPIYNPRPNFRSEFINNNKKSDTNTRFEQSSESHENSNSILISTYSAVPPQPNINLAEKSFSTNFNLPINQIVKMKSKSPESILKKIHSRGKLPLELIERDKRNDGLRRSTDLFRPSSVIIPKAERLSDGKQNNFSPNFINPFSALENSDQINRDVHVSSSVGSVDGQSMKRIRVANNPFRNSLPINMEYLGDMLVKMINKDEINENNSSLLEIHVGDFNAEIDKRKSVSAINRIQRNTDENNIFTNWLNSREQEEFFSTIEGRNYQSLQDQQTFSSSNKKESYVNTKNVIGALNMVIGAVENTKTGDAVYLVQDNSEGNKRFRRFSGQLNKYNEQVSDRSPELHPAGSHVISYIVRQ